MKIVSAGMSLRGLLEDLDPVLNRRAAGAVDARMPLVEQQVAHVDDVARSKRMIASAPVWPGPLNVAVTVLVAEPLRPRLVERRVGDDRRGAVRRRGRDLLLQRSGTSGCATSFLASARNTALPPVWSPW